MMPQKSVNRLPDNKHIQLEVQKNFRGRPAYRGMGTYGNSEVYKNGRPSRSRGLRRAIGKYQAQI